MPGGSSPAPAAGVVLNSATTTLTRAGLAARVRASLLGISACELVAMPEGWSGVTAGAGWGSAVGWITTGLDRRTIRKFLKEN